MGIVNAGQIGVYDDIPKDLLGACGGCAAGASPHRHRAHGDLRGEFKGAPSEEAMAAQAAWREGSVEERLKHAPWCTASPSSSNGHRRGRVKYVDPVLVIEGPLMAGMNVVGDLFGSGKMFLPQVVKSARVMKRAVAWLTLHRSRKRPRR